MSNFNLDMLPRQVWAYYHPFFGNPKGPTGRWLTWNEPLGLSSGYEYEGFKVSEAVKEKLNHNPDEFLGIERRSNYSVFYPMLGLYDCLDPSVLEHHAHWANQAGLDGFLWDYQLVGEDNSDKDKPLQETIYDRSLRIMLDVLDKIDTKVNLWLFYDSFCWYNYPVDKIVEHLSYLVRTYYGHPRILHFDNRLVINLYNVAAKSTSEWYKIRTLLQERNIKHQIFMVAGEIPSHKPDFNEPNLFEGFSQYNYLEDWSADGVTRLSKTLLKLAKRNGARFWSTTVGPGFDGRIWHHPGRVITRGLGKLYETMWEAAIAAKPNFITVCSFNEWGEGTQIEPALEYENLFLELTAKWANIFRENR